jgi:hypothetical protein
MDFLQRTGAEISFKKGKLALSTKEVAPQAYELARSNHAVLTLFSEDKASRIPQPKRRAKPNLAARRDDRLNPERAAECAGGNAPADKGSTEASIRNNDRKLFVGGLSRETTDKELREHFHAYGKIKSVNVKTDPTTGRSRGFAFIVFTQADSIDKVLSARDHTIDRKSESTKGQGVQSWTQPQATNRQPKGKPKTSLQIGRHCEQAVA